MLLFINYLYFAKSLQLLNIQTYFFMVTFILVEYVKLNKKKTKTANSFMYFR